MHSITLIEEPLMGDGIIKCNMLTGLVIAKQLGILPTIEDNEEDEN